MEVERTLTVHSVIHRVRRASAWYHGAYQLGTPRYLTFAFFYTVKIQKNNDFTNASKASAAGLPPTIFGVLTGIVPVLSIDARDSTAQFKTEFITKV